MLDVAIIVLFVVSCSFWLSVSEEKRFKLLIKIIFELKLSGTKLMAKIKGCIFSICSFIAFSCVFIVFPGAIIKIGFCPIIDVSLFIFSESSILCDRWFTYSSSIMFWQYWFLFSCGIWDKIKFTSFRGELELQEVTLY